MPTIVVGELPSAICLTLEVGALSQSLPTMGSGPPRDRILFNGESMPSRPLVRAKVLGVEARSQPVEPQTPFSKGSHAVNDALLTRVIPTHRACAPHSALYGLSFAVLAPLSLMLFSYSAMVPKIWRMSFRVGSSWQEVLHPVAATPAGSLAARLPGPARKRAVLWCFPTGAE